MLRRIWDTQYEHETGSIHRKAFANDIDPSTRKQTNSHSVSRENYTSAAKLRSLAPDPERFGVVAVVVKEYEVMDQKVCPDPTTDDLGHSNAIGLKTQKVKNHLRKQAVIRIPPSRPSESRS